MTWPGTTTITASGAPEIINADPKTNRATVVPKRATFAVAGDKGSPDATVRFEVREGVPECIEIVVKAKPAGRGIRSSDMTLFNIDNLIANVLGEVGGAVEIDPVTGVGSGKRGGEHDEHNRWAVSGAVSDRRVHGGRGSNQVELQQVADIYLAHLDSAPAKAVATLLGYADRTAARRVNEARAAGLLPESTQRKRKA